MRHLSRLFPVLLGIAAVAGQSSSSPSPSPSVSISLSLTTSTVTSTITTRVRNQNSVIVTAIPTSFNVSYTFSATPTSSASASASATPAPIVLDTRLDPAFGVLGALLVLTGLPSAFWGHKNRWTSFFLIGFYTFSLTCLVLILKFGVLTAVNPPSKTLRGMFVLSSAIAGIAGGAIAIFFWKAARYCIGGWGGFAFALWIQCFQNGGLIKPIGYRWMMYVGSGVVGFVLCTIPKIHYHVLLISTAFVGSEAFILGVDCYTTAGLKEFFIWNLGFASLFPKFRNNWIEFPVSQTMQIELGLIAAVALMGAAVQLRILSVLQRKLKEIAQEQKQRDEEAEAQAADRYAHVLRERDEWEKEHPSKLGRYDSGFSSMPLMKDRDGSSSPITPEQRYSNIGRDSPRNRHHSGLSEFMTVPTSDEDLKRATRNLQSPGALPTLDLGFGIQDDVPQSFMAKDGSPNHAVKSPDLEGLKRKEELVAEIQTIRRSIDVLKSETQTPSSSTAGSRRPSITSRRTLSVDLNSALAVPTPTHLRPPRSNDPRSRVRSMEMSALEQAAAGQSISRPTSAPLQSDWDSYVQERKLLQPPSGITPPIATTTLTPPTSARIAMPPAVADALMQRKRRESALGMGGEETDSSEDIPLSKLQKQGPKRRGSTGGNIPVTILPPRKGITAIASPTPQRTNTRTFEELNERHREKMRDLQGPLTQSQKEHAELEAAKQRWERSRALEREAVMRRQAEKAAQLEKRKRGDDDGGERTGRRSTTLDKPRNRHSRSLSATMKVEDWIQYQAENGKTERSGTAGTSTKKDKVPFPDGRDRRKSRELLQ